jgi:hypothetical protein
VALRRRFISGITMNSLENALTSMNYNSKAHVPYRRKLVAFNDSIFKFRREMLKINHLSVQEYTNFVMDQMILGEKTSQTLIGNSGEISDDSESDYMLIQSQMVTMN